MNWRIFCLIACGAEAVRAAGRAMGLVPQDLFSDSAIWAHWVPALGWAVIGLRVAVKGTEE
jgi:hypothetical protein